MKILRILIIITGILIGLWLGLYVMLYGGICQIIDGINPLNAKDIALGVIRILFCEIGFIPFWLGFIVASTIEE